jgi:hypothetical protein
LVLPYVHAALHSFEATGLILGFTCWAKLHRDLAAEQSSLLDDYVYETMLAGRWDVVLHLASWGCEQESFDASGRLTFRFNAWLALKRLGRFAECALAVKAYDTSAVKNIFAIARAALLDDLDDLFELIERTKASEFDERAWTEWPLLDEARKDPRFGTLRERFDEQPSHSTTVEAQKQLAPDTGTTDIVEASTENEGSQGSADVDPDSDAPAS